MIRKTPTHPRRHQSGYLLEVPIIVFVVFVALAILLPALPKTLAKAVAVLGAVVILGGLYYMIVIPGWQPTDTHRLRWPWNLLVFLVIAVVIAIVTVGFVLGG